MFKKLSLLILILPFVVLSCDNSVKDRDLDRLDGPLKVLILGNSITYHSASTDLDWSGNWGMAATSAEKDFQHLLTNKLHQEFPQNEIEVTAKNIAVWERNFNYNFEDFLDIQNQKYDILIIRLGENVNAESTDFVNYEIELNKLINRFKGETTKVIITGTVWNSPIKDQIQEKVSKDNNYYYVSLLDFQSNSKNYATGKFSNEGVAAHPSDFGMQTIADKLFKQVETILNN